MKKYIFLLLLVPTLLFAQNIVKTIALDCAKFHATINNTTNFSDEPTIKVEESEGRMKEVKIKFNSDARISIEPIPPGLTAKSIMSQFKSLAAKKQKDLVIKVLETGANHILISRTRDGKTIYKAMYIPTINKVTYLVSTNEVDSLENCKQLLVMAKTLKAK